MTGRAWKGQEGRRRAGRAGKLGKPGKPGKPRKPGKPGDSRRARELWGAPGRAKTLGTVGGASEARHQAKPSLSDILWPSDTPRPNHTRLLRFLMSSA